MGPASAGRDSGDVLAYLITFRCYGTWLHGDERGSMDRRKDHLMGGDVIQPNKRRRECESRLCKHPPVSLDQRCRRIVDQTIKKTCDRRGWFLQALNVQSDHVHLVVTADRNPEVVMNSLKACSTRRLRLAGLVSPKTKPWSRHGSTHWLWTENEVLEACLYVDQGQAEPPEST